jgi:hypothetical protein
MSSEPLRVIEGGRAPRGWEARRRTRMARAHLRGFPACRSWCEETRRPPVLSLLPSLLLGLVRWLESLVAPGRSRR